MQFKIAATVLAFATTVFGTTINVYEPVEQTYTAGDAVVIEWSFDSVPADSAVDITLIGGATQGTQVPLSTIATSVSALSYTWTIPTDISIVAYYGFIVKLTSDSTVTQYSNPIHIKAADTTTVSPDTTVDVTSTVTGASYGTKTVSLSSAAETTTEAPVYSEPADYTKVIEVTDTTTVPCNTTTVYTPPQQNTATYVVPTYGNATFTTAVVPPTTQGGSSATSTPVTGAAVRFAAGPAAVIGGLLVAAFAL